jgi:hypothetical protein
MVVQMVSVPLSDALADPKLSEAMTGAGAGAEANGGWAALTRGATVARV